MKKLIAISAATAALAIAGVGYACHDKTDTNLISNPYSLVAADSDADTVFEAVEMETITITDGSADSNAAASTDNQQTTSLIDYDSGAENGSANDSVSDSSSDSSNSADANSENHYIQLIAEDVEIDDEGNAVVNFIDEVVTPDQGSSDTAQFV